MLASTEFLPLRPASGMGMAYIWLLLSSDRFRAQAGASATGTSKSHQRIQPKALMAKQELRPPAKVVEAFEAIAMPILRRIEAAKGQSETLAALRDLLLPKLMSGEIRLPEAEAAAASLV